MGTEFRFVRCATEQLFGIDEQWATKQAKVRVSDIDRTIIDGLKQPEHCGGLTEVAKGLWMQREKMHPERLVEYAIRLNIGAVIRRLGYLLDLYELGTDKTAKALTAQLTNTYVSLDPVLPSQGKHLHRWRLCLNVEPEELLSIVRT